MSPHTSTYLDTTAYLASAYSSICVVRAVADDAGISHRMCPHNTTLRTYLASAYSYSSYSSAFFFFKAVADDAGLSDNESQAASRVGKAGGVGREIMEKKAAMAPGGGGGHALGGASLGASRSRATRGGGVGGGRCRRRGRLTEARWQRAV